VLLFSSEMTPQVCDEPNLLWRRRSIEMVARSLRNRGKKFYILDKTSSAPMRTNLSSLRSLALQVRVEGGVCEA
jgi:hypothetical protein